MQRAGRPQGQPHPLATVRTHGGGSPPAQEFSKGLGRSNSADAELPSQPHASGQTGRPTARAGRGQAHDAPLAPPSGEWTGGRAAGRADHGDDQRSVDSYGTDGSRGEYAAHADAGAWAPDWSRPSSPRAGLAERGYATPAHERGAGQPPPARQSSRYEGRGYEDRGYEGRGYEDRGYEGRGYEGRGYEGRGYETRGYEGRGFGGNTPASTPGYAPRGAPAPAEYYAAPHGQGGSRAPTPRGPYDGYQGAPAHQEYYGTPQGAPVHRGYQGAPVHQGYQGAPVHQGYDRGPQGGAMDQTYYGVPQHSAAAARRHDNPSDPAASGGAGYYASQEAPAPAPREAAQSGFMSQLNALKHAFVEGTHKGKNPEMYEAYVPPPMPGAEAMGHGTAQPTGQGQVPQYRAYAVPGAQARPPQGAPEYGTAPAQPQSAPYFAAHAAPATQPHAWADPTPQRPQPYAAGPGRVTAVAPPLSADDVARLNNLRHQMATYRCATATIAKRLALAMGLEVAEGLQLAGMLLGPLGNLAMSGFTAWKNRENNALVRDARQQEEHLKSALQQCAHRIGSFDLGKKLGTIPDMMDLAADLLMPGVGLFTSGYTLYKQIDLKMSIERRAEILSTIDERVGRLLAPHHG